MRSPRESFWRGCFRMRAFFFIIVSLLTASSVPLFNLISLLGGAVDWSNLRAEECPYGDTSVYFLDSNTLRQISAWRGAMTPCKGWQKRGRSQTTTLIDRERSELEIGRASGRERV